MARVVSAVVIAAAVLVGPAPLLAQQVQAAGAEEAAQDRQPVEQAEKRAVAAQILEALEQAQQRGALEAGFRQYWIDRLTRLSTPQLLAISDAGPGTNLLERIANVAVVADGDGAAPDLGDSAADLVFTKVTPCRVADTRGAGGLLAGGSQRNFYVAGGTPGLFTPQGGTSCGIPVGATSVAANVTVTGTTGPGWLRAWPYGGSSAASIINYAAADTIANGLVLPICDPAATTCTRDLTVRADAAGAHVIIDVMGYFRRVNKDDYRTTVTQAIRNVYALIPQSCTSYMSLTVAAPGAGTIMVEGVAGAFVGHTSGSSSSVILTVGTSSTDCSWTSASDQGFVEFLSGEDSGTYSRQLRVKRLYEVSAGSHTYHLTSTRGQATIAAFLGASLMATFHPQ